MPCLPARLDREKIRQLGELVVPAEDGDMAAAREAFAHEYGFASWARVEREVARRETLNSRELARVEAMLAAEPALATEPMEHWCDHSRVAPISYIAMIAFDADRLGLPRGLTGTGAVAHALLASGADADGLPEDQETPLITAASYGDAEVARVLVEHGADVDALAAPTSGGVPGGSALLHAAVFGMTDVLDIVVAAGARVRSLVEAAAAGDISAWPLGAESEEERVRALVMAADHQRLGVIDELVSAGTPVDAVDAEWDRQALRLAAEHGRPASVRHLLALGADPNLRDAEGRTALDMASPEHRYRDSPAHEQVEAILRPLTRAP